MRAWIELVEYFEYTQRHLRLREYRTRYEQLTLEEAEGPEALYLEMKRLQRQMERLGETVTEEASTDKFLQAVQKSYKEEVRVYEATLFSGAKVSMENLMEMIRRSEKMKKKDEITEMKEFITLKTCQVCKKNGHTKENCWIEHPEKRPNGRNTKKFYPRNNKQPQVTCWKCGRQGHRQKECRTRDYSDYQRPGMAAATKPVSRYTPEKENYIDSACSVHIVSSIDLLHGAQQINERTVQSASGELIRLTHKGTRIINTKNGPLKLSEVYYCEDMEYNLISVPKLADKAVEIKFSPREAYLQKGNVRIHLSRRDGLWTLP